MVFQLLLLSSKIENECVRPTIWHQLERVLLHLAKLCVRSKIPGPSRRNCVRVLVFLAPHDKFVRVRWILWPNRSRRGGAPTISDFARLRPPARPPGPPRRSLRFPRYTRYHLPGMRGRGHAWVCLRLLKRVSESECERVRAHVGLGPEFASSSYDIHHHNIICIIVVDIVSIELVCARRTHECTGGPSQYALA